MQTQPIAAPLTKGGTIDSSASHLWSRSATDPRLWLVIPADVTAPVYLATPDDFGTLVPVGGAQ